MNTQSKFSNKKWLAIELTIVTLAAISTGCGSSTATSSGGGAITLSGSLGTSGSVAAHETRKDEGLEFLDSDRGAVSLSSLTVNCVTSTASGTGTVSASGSFSVTVPNSQGQQIGCFIFDNTSIVGTLVFSNPNQQSLSGGTSTSTAQAFSGNAVLPPITLNLTTGQAVVDITQITAASGGGTVIEAQIVATSAAFDYSGNWAITAMPTASMRTNEVGVYSNTLCANQQNNNCNGPPAGQILEIKRAVGVDGGGNPAYAALLWQGATGFESCGSVIGTTYASIKTQSGIDFSASGLAQGPFVYSSSVTVNSTTYTLATTGTGAGWEITSPAPTAQYTMQNCVNTTVAVAGQQVPGQLCKDSTHNVYQYQLGGGCFDGSGNPIQIQNWSQVTPGSCQQANLGGGFTQQTCTNTFNSAAITCTNINSDDRNSSGADLGTNTFNWSDVTAVATQGVTTCASMVASGTDSTVLAGLECYANAFYNSGIQNASGACLPQINTNWNATSSAGFLQSSNNPNNLIVADLFQYNPGGQSGSIHHQQTNSQGVQVQGAGGGSQQIGCPVLQVEDISFESAGSTQMRAKYTQKSSYSVSSNDPSYSPACAAAFAAGAGNQAFIFFLDKQ